MNLSCHLYDHVGWLCHPSLSPRSLIFIPGFAGALGNIKVFFFFLIWILTQINKIWLPWERGAEACGCFRGLLVVPGGILCWDGPSESPHSTQTQRKVTYTAHLKCNGVGNLHTITFKSPFSHLGTEISRSWDLWQNHRKSYRVEATFHEALDFWRTLRLVGRIIYVERIIPHYGSMKDHNLTVTAHVKDTGWEELAKHLCVHVSENQGNSPPDLGNLWNLQGSGSSESYEICPTGSKII